MAALTIQAPVKWLDNLLSHHQLPGIERAKQGVERRISHDGLLAIELVRILSEEAGFTLGHAATFAKRALEGRAEADFGMTLAPGVELRIDVRVLDDRVRLRLPDAIEAAPRVTRGRPARVIPKKTPDA